MTVQQPYTSFEVFTGAPGIHIPAETLNRWFGQDLSVEDVERVVAVLSDAEVVEGIVSVLRIEAGIEED